jgi:hypothetical protein
MADKEFFTFDSQISDNERFKEADAFSIRCSACEATFAFQGLVEDQVSGVLRMVHHPLTPRREQRSRLSALSALLASALYQRHPWRFNSSSPFARISLNTISGGRSVMAKVAGRGRG